MPSIKQLFTSYLFSKKLLYFLLAVVAVFVALNNLVLPWYVNHGEILRVPNVIGQPLDSARSQLWALGFVAVESDTRPDPQAPSGTVLAQNPDAEASVKNGRRVYLTISGGEVLVIVPALRGRSVRDAKFTLERSGLRIGDVVYAASDAYPDNTIMEQSIQPGVRVSKNTVVKITVSRGKDLQQTTVQDFTGKTLAEAERLIARQGLKLGNITYQASFDLIPNTVVDQFPRGGESVAAEQAVDLFVIKTGKPKEEIQHPKK